MMQDMNSANQVDGSLQSEPKPKKRKIITVVIFFIVLSVILYVGIDETMQWWQEKQMWVKAGFASDKFPFRMFTERELVEKGLWSGESQQLNAIITTVRPEETYAKFRQALIDEDLDVATKCFTKEQQEAWRKSLYEIKDKGFLQGMIDDLPEKLEDSIQRDLNNTSIESYAYVLNNDPQESVRILEFSKSWEGEWKINNIH